MTYMSDEFETWWKSQKSYSHRDKESAAIGWNAAVENNVRAVLAKASQLPLSVIGRTYLPKITDDHIQQFSDEGLIEFIDGKPSWTQLAVDFCCAIPFAESSKASQQVHGNTDLAIQDKRYALGVIAGWNAGSAAGYWQGRVDVSRGYDSYPKPSDSILRSAQAMIKDASEALKAMPAPKQEPEYHCFGCKIEHGTNRNCDICGVPLSVVNAAPPQAAAIPESNDVWLDSLYQSAKALVRADENNTGNEHSVSVYYRAAEEFIQVSSDWPKFGHLSAAPKPEGE